MFRKLSNETKREEGQGLVEYALILVLVSVVVIVILAQMGPAVGNIFSGVVTVLNGGGTGDLAAAVNDTEEDELVTETCLHMNYGDYASIRSDGKIPVGTQAYRDNTCTTTPAGTIIRNSVYTGPGNNLAQANALCQEHYGTDSTQQIWMGSNNGFYYCA